MSRPAVVHLARCEVAALLRDAPAPAQWLAPGESTRLATLTTDRRRAQFVAARWQVRRLLARVLGGAATDWALTGAADAPPAVAGRPDLRLSITHSGPWTACALATGEVGLDLEAPQRRRDIAGLAALCCTERERAWLAAAPDAEAAFYTLWTVKEAWLKRRGEWIAPSRLAELDAAPSDREGVRTWAGEGWRLALCADAREVRWWTPEPAATGCWDVQDSGATR